MDPVRDLNNLLQHYRDNRGNNLARYLSWLLQQTGPDHQRVHYATAKLHGQIIGSGSGVSIGNAKQVAAGQALQYLRTLPPGHPMFSLQQL